MSVKAIIARLRQCEIQPTPQRLAVAQAVLDTDAHPTADEVWTKVKHKHPTVSRATVYNTLNLLVEKKLLRSYALAEGTTVFDPHVELHHHFIDEETGEIHDIPWDALRVKGSDLLPGFDVREYQVILRGRKKK